jgi:3-hydroxyacyl-CoA dehydrogenase
MSAHKIITNILYKSVIKVTFVNRLQRITRQDEITHTNQIAISITNLTMGRECRDGMVIRFTTTYVISANHL